MNNLPKQILNYFATFTETRFNFRRLINYKWTNNELTLDFSFFPQFQTKLLEKIKTGDMSPVSVKQDEQTIVIPKDQITAEIEKVLIKDFNSAYIDKCQNEEVTNISDDIKADPELFEKQVKLVQDEVVRLYLVALRRQFEAILINLQEKIVDQKKAEFGIEHTPPSIFGVANYVNQHFEKIKLFTRNYKSSDIFVDDVKKYFEENIKDIVIYDLFYNLQKYTDFSQLGTLFLFFHSLEKDTDGYPLYFVEAELKNTSTEITLSLPRNLILLNTPAINFFKFENVLTIPRASSPSVAKSHLTCIESFFQNLYGFQTPFILEPLFNPITHGKDSYPAIKCRIGLQTVVNEDKKLLDYSELMTKIELGEDSKFSKFIDQYIKGTVPNHQEEVDQVFRDNYPLQSPKRYVSDSPIPLNNSQKRILLALANEKNNIIVVDGPPGTGKSHTIAALTYWANEQRKSVLVTSHKKEALDVIDRMLTDKFKDLHPQAKPSIIRMDKETGSSNNLPNTLQTSVINAANERNLGFNSQAVLDDASAIEQKIYNTVDSKLSQNKEYQNYIKKIIALDAIEAELSTDPTFPSIFTSISYPKETLDFSKLNPLINPEDANQLAGLSFDEYKFLLDRQQLLPEFLEACEKLNQIPADSLQINLNITEIPQKFQDFIIELNKYFKSDISINKLCIKDTTSGPIKKLFGQGPKDSQLKELLSNLKSLEYRSSINNIAQYLSKDPDSLTLEDLSSGILKIRFALSVKPYLDLISSYQALPGNSGKDIVQIYDSIKKFISSSNIFTNDLSQALDQLFSIYGSLLDNANITQKDLSSLSRLISGDPTANKIWQWIQLHSELSCQADADSLNRNDINTHFKLKQKEIENINDQRLKDLNNHLGDIAKIKVSYDGGKRFSTTEASVLLSSVSCVIAEPSTISKFFPMEEGLIDVLIIDEASQVSIADSISLILRAKQVVIFGDEYQYGAVSALNVSSKYSTSYFSEIVSAYADDYNTTISEIAKKELVDEISKDINDDEQQSDTLLKPQEGTILWLKTFDIRTSTLTFAKAIANYTTSLKEHFRSFPEIIGYSNDFFYKEAQMELLVNRIRTKPIGEVLQFIQVDCQGKSGANVNLDEIDAIGDDIQKRIDTGFKGTIGIITSFKEQQARLEQYLNERFNMPLLVRDHKLAIWFVGDVQGEERDLIYYSFVEAKDINNANLASIYPVVGGTADNIRSLKMQRLNVGFSRAKDTMVFVHSQPLEKFSNTALGKALKHYQHTLEVNQQNDFFVEDESVFDSPMEKKLYSLLLQTSFVQKNRDHIKIVPQFNIGKYIAQEYATSIPKYRTDFLLTFSNSGKEKVLILEYDGLEYHFKNPSDVDHLNFSQEYIDYDVSRQLELESYGYHFLRLNKFNLRPKTIGETEVDVLNHLLEERLQ
jgi:superfamily I DNA and/or RNA helicase